jgi:5'-nucleotidase
VKTMHRPLRVHQVDLADGSPALTTDGAPSDCVSLAILGLVPKQIDLVVSGINPSANLGHDVTYSGTVTAAMEAVIWGIPGVAVSLDTPDNHPGQLDYQPAALAAGMLVRELFRSGLPGETLLNVNVPYLSSDQIKGFKITRQGLRVYRDSLVTRHDPRGRPYYWIGGEAPTGIPEDGSDFGALAQGFVSVTPLQLDLTDYKAMESLRSWELPKEN